MKQPHLLCEEEDIAPYVLLPGDPELVERLTAICRENEYAYHIGVVRSQDSFYIDEEAELMDKWNKKGMLGSDMETAALFTVARLRGARAASILNNVVLCQADVKEGISDYVDEDQLVAKGERRQIFVALEVARQMSKRVR